MEQAILEQLQQLPESAQHEALRYLEGLVAKHTPAEPTATPIDRHNAFCIWQGKIWMADDFDAPLDDMQEYM
jgi:hypothetical protein